MIKKKEEEEKNMSAALKQPIALSEAKKDFSKLYKRAESGLEVVIENRHSGLASASLVNTDILTAIMDSITFTVIETPDDEAGRITVAIDELPVLYGEGNTREEAVEDLIDTVAEYCEVYVDNLSLYSQADTPMQRALMMKLLRCENDRDAIRKVLKV